MNIAKRVGIGATSLFTIGALLAPSALADVGCTISGNGASSHNTCNITVNGSRHRGGGISTSNTAVVTNTVRVKSSTGGNEANKNTGGNVNITTGDSNVDVSITNNVNTP